MSNPGDADATPITSVAATGRLYRRRLQADGTLPHRHRAREVRLPPRRPDARRPICRRTASPARSATCWTGLQRFGGTPITDHGNIIGLKQGDAAISLEPAGQLELSGAPLETLHETKAELETHFDQVRSVSRDLRIGFAPLGFHPLATRERRCRGCRRAATPSCGATCRWSARCGLDMMTRTCTVQVNLDYASEADMRAQAARVAAAAAAGHRAVRQLAVHRGPAERLPVLSRPCLDRHRQPALRHPAR